MRWLNAIPQFHNMCLSQPPNRLICHLNRILKLILSQLNLQLLIPTVPSSLWHYLLLKPLIRNRESAVMSLILQSLLGYLGHEVVRAVVLLDLMMNLGLLFLVGDHGRRVDLRHDFKARAL
jgi:hypothetical protein